MELIKIELEHMNNINKTDEFFGILNGNYSFYCFLAQNVFW